MDKSFLSIFKRTCVLFIIPINIFFAQSDWSVEEETRIEGSVSGTIKKGTIFKTVSGNYYEVTGLTLQLVLELSPEVMVLRKGDIYKLVVHGFDESLICSKLKDVIESKISGEFQGWDGETIFKLSNGQIWQQSSYSYTYHYAYRPTVMIYRSGSTFKMKVEDVDDVISVERLK